MYFSVVISAALLLAYLVLQLVRPEWRFALWIAVILAVVVPWATWHGEGFWDGVNWIPFSTTVAPWRLRDVLINLILYFPFGYLFVLHHVSGKAGIVVATVGALVLSLATEWSQVYGFGRFPSMTDVVMNTLGGMVGGVMATRGRAAGTR